MVNNEASAKIPAEIKSMSFEEALQELEKIVEGLEQGAGKLDDAIKDYERGAILKKHCELKLSEARSRVEKITVGNQGNVQASPIDFSKE